MKTEFLHTGLSQKSRFIISSVLYLLAALLQVYSARQESISILAFRFAGLLLLFVPLWFLKVRNFSNKPEVKKKDAAGANAKNAAKGAAKGAGKKGGTWRPAELRELRRFNNRVRASQKIKVPRLYNQYLGCLVTLFGFPFFLFISSFILAMLSSVFRISYEPYAPFSILYLFLLFYPSLWFAKIEKWDPPVSSRFEALDPIINAGLPPRFQLDSMLLFDEWENIPSDVRLMIAPSSGAPEQLRNELVGAQFQVSINKGADGNVPYVYAVFITKGRGKIWDTLSKLNCNKYITEPGSSTEGKTVYGTVVVRLDTTSRSDGYHTKKGDVLRLFEIVVNALVKL